MSGLSSVGTRALLANQAALQTAGNNIANVNTPGYSRQSVVLQAVEGQFTGGGYIGKGVEIKTIQRNFSAFLTRQSALAGATQSADSTRADKLKQLEGVFDSGSAGLGASISDMLNAFSDVATAPTDLTARTVAITRVDETASRMRAASQRLDDLQQGVTEELGQKVDAINSLAKNIADTNGQIARALGTGQSPNDLLDRRDQLVRELNTYVQTSSIPADDGTVGIFLGGSQALVMGTSVSEVSLAKDDFGDPLKSKLAITHSGVSTVLDESTLGGGQVSGLLRFQNTDMVEGRNLLGRLTTAISSTMNDQHRLGIDLDGNVGGDLFTPITFGAKNVLKPTQDTPPAPTVALNSGLANLNLSISDASKFVASDYEVRFTSTTDGTITRLSDGVVISFPQTPATTSPILATLDGLNISLDQSSPGVSDMPEGGNRFLIKPFSGAANNIKSQFATPRSLAVASLASSATSSSLQTGSTLALQARDMKSVAATAAVTLTFDGAGGYTRSDTGATTYTYSPGSTIEYDLASPGATGWSLKLSGTPVAGDTFTVEPNSYYKLNAGNATAMMALRDKATFDGAALTDGYAGLIAQVGIRSQSANYASEVSGAIATNLEKDRAGVSGVNLDEEAAKLLQYQQAYQASAKLIQISQSIFDTLIQGLGR